MPYCSKKPTNRSCKKENCSICYEHTLHKWLVDNNLVDHWISDDDPKKLIPGSHKKYWFKCKNKECSHRIEKPIREFVSYKRYRFCTGTESCGDIKCLFCSERSIIIDLTDIQAKLFKEDNDMDPLIVRKQSNEEYIFRCKTCTHKVEMITYSYFLSSGCKYCSDKSLCYDKDCTLCWNDRLASLFSLEERNNSMLIIREPHLT